VVDPAERVGDAVLAAVSNQDDAGVRDGLAALGAPLERLVGREVDRPGLPVSSVKSPRDDVLEAAEGRAPLSRRFADAEAILGVNTDPAPAASDPTHAREARARGR